MIIDDSFVKTMRLGHKNYFIICEDFHIAFSCLIFTSFLQFSTALLMFTTLIDQRGRVSLLSLSDDRI